MCLVFDITASNLPTVCECCEELYGLECSADGLHCVEGSDEQDMSNVMGPSVLVVATQRNAVTAALNFPIGFVLPLHKTVITMSDYFNMFYQYNNRYYGLTQ